MPAFNKQMETPLVTSELQDMDQYLQIINVPGHIINYSHIVLP